MLGATVPGHSILAQIDNKPPILQKEVNNLKKVQKVDYISTKATIDKLEEDRKELANSLLKELEFMDETLEALKDSVNKSGVITKMCQGKYDIERANPALNQYNVLIKNYTSCIKQLNDILPKELSCADDELDGFVND